MFKYSQIIILLGVVVTLFSCEHVNKSLELGNNAYSDNHFSKAIKHYDKALTLDSASFVAQFNKGNALYKKGIGKDTVVPHYENLIKQAQTEDQIAKLYHNIGNTYLSNELYEEAIEAYKSTLRLRPDFEDTRYNLAYAQLHIPPKQDSSKNQQNKKNQQNDQNQNNQDQNQNKKQDQENKDQQKSDQNKDQDNKNGDQSEDQSENQKQDQGDDPKDSNGDQKKSNKEGNKNPQPQPGKLSKEQAKRLLDHIKRQEKGIRAKVNKGKEKNASSATEGKNW